MVDRVFFLAFPWGLCCLFLCFKAISGLKINLAKSESVHVCNVNNVEDLAHVLGCKVSSLPMKYLCLLWEEIRLIFGMVFLRRLNVVWLVEAVVLVYG